MSEISRLARVVSSSVAGEATAQALTLLSGLVVARMLGPDRFGAYGLVVATVQLLAGWGMLAQSITVSRHVGLWAATSPERAGSVISLGLVISGLASTVFAAGLVVFATPIAERVGVPNLAISLRLAAALAPLTVLVAMCTSILLGLQAYSTLPLSGALRGISIALGIIGGAIGGSLKSVIIGGVCGNAVALLCVALLVGRELSRTRVHLGLENLLREKAVLFQFSLPQFLASATAAWAVWFATSTLGAHTSLSDVAALTVARQWQSVMTFLPVTAASVLLPLLAGDRELGRRASFVTAHRLTMLCVSAGAGAVIVLTPLLLRLYGTAYHSAAGLVIWLVGGTAIGFLGNALGAQILARGDAWFAAIMNTVWAIIVSVAVAFTIPRFGAVGIGYAFALAYCATLTMAAFRLQRVKDLSAGSVALTAGGAASIALVLIALSNPTLSVFVRSSTVAVLLGYIAISASSLRVGVPQ